ncbi:restriction endonuclease subunit S [Methylobacterium sp. WCS2018Hpa-22]|uniref:restriction endonuclease subunit S n=1 Tax=Methylobacterium sp. WCS2018Hpa-22 TaxID=3073633 RepID=UPI002888FE45|nr:restriction endonuclease subunit S [Methylobacterium sp. WCS2018Hpa-22]
MSFPAYQKYVERKVEWIGATPNHWAVCALNYRYIVELGKMLDESRITGNFPGYYLRNTDVQWGKINIIDLPLMDFNGSDVSRYSLRPGDLLVCEGGEVGRAAIWNGGVDPCYYQKALHRLRPRYHERDDVRYLFYVLTCAAKFGAFSGGEAKATIAHLPAETLRRHLFPFPPTEEQRAIADFLNRETAKIDALVEEQRRLIALLREKRRAIIFHAVTKGLAPDAIMKDSGIGWLGEVPAHWKIMALRRLIDQERPITYGIVQPGEGDPEGRFMVRGQDYSRGWVMPEEIFRVSDVVELPYRRARLKPGDVVITIVGAGLGNTAVIPAFLDGGNITQTTARLAPATGIISSDYLALALGSNIGSIQVSLYQKGAAQPGLNLEHLSAFQLPLPPLEEQQHVVRWLAPVLRQISEITAAAEQMVVLFNERRAALISAAVTGKIDVRPSAAVLTFPIDRVRARRLVATEIIEQSASQPTFGRTKLQKVLYLAETHANINELAGRYIRMPYGPLDQMMIKEVEDGALEAGFVVDDPGDRKMVRYHPCPTKGRFRAKLAQWLGDERIAKLDKLITDFADLDTRAAEAIATLYAVWNDALIDGETPADMEIALAFLSEWHPEKARKFRIDELQIWLDWMRRHGLVPTGAGSKTSTGRLFA